MILELLDRRARVGEYVCKPLTVAGALLLQSLFGEELRFLADSSPSTLAEIKAAIDAALQMAPNRALRVVVACLDDPLGPHTDRIGKAALRELAHTIAELTAVNGERVVEALGIDRIAATSSAAPPASHGDAPTDQEIAISVLALKYGKTPQEIAAWPLETFLCVCECLGESKDSPPPKQFDPAAGISGMGYKAGVMGRK